MELLERQIDGTDRKIDPASLKLRRASQLVYELYGLTDKEIRIVEEATR